MNNQQCKMTKTEQHLQQLRQEYKYANEARRKEILFTVETIKRSDYLNPVKVEDKFTKEVEKALL